MIDKIEKKKYINKNQVKTGTYRDHKTDRELKAHVHPSCFARPVLQKTDFGKLKIAVFSVCSVTLRLRVKKANTLPDQNPEFDKKVFQNKKKRAGL